ALRHVLARKLTRRPRSDPRFRGNDGKERSPAPPSPRSLIVTPALGRHRRESGGPSGAAAWIPACAGMTEERRLAALVTPTKAGGHSSPGPGSRPARGTTRRSGPARRRL